MPKQTFLNLGKAKQKQIIDAFLREFSLKTFDEASLSEVVKKLGIAKGSIYQYFDGKLDLFLYLIETCASVKRKYVEAVARDNHLDFWAYFQELYIKGFQFDAENPLESHFLHSLSQNIHSPSVQDLYKKMMQQTVLAFEKMVQYEIEAGYFRSDISQKTMAYMLYKAGSSIQEQLEFEGVINPKQSIEKQSPVYKNKKQALLQTVGDYIQLLKPSFEKK